MWPGNLRPPAFAASLLIGPVTMPSTSPLARERARALDPLQAGAALVGDDLAEAHVADVVEVDQVDDAALAPRLGRVLDAAQLEVEPAALDHLREHAVVADHGRHQVVVGGALGERLGHDLGADPRGIAQGQRERRPSHPSSFHRSSTSAASVSSSPTRPPFVTMGRPDHGPPAIVPRAHSGATSPETDSR